MHLVEFQAAGQMLHRAGLITGSSGNLSLRLSNNLLITRHGSILAALTGDDLIETGIFQDDAMTPVASSELPVHRQIYRNTGAKAIVHSHAPFAVTLSLGNCPTPHQVSVIGQSDRIVPGALGAEIAGALNLHEMVLVRGHGPFAIGQTLAEACRLTLEFETECRRICEARELEVRPDKEWSDGLS
jgi:L-fuculose-phosphate aldolase